MKRIILVFLYIIFCLWGLSANVGAYKYGRGGMIYPVKNNVLSMEYEKIDIDVYGSTFQEDETLNYGAIIYKSYYYIEYHCFYEFKNNGDTSDFLLGFPVSFGKGGSSSCPEMYTSNPVFADMQIMVNDRHVDFKPYIHGCNPELTDIDYDEVYGFTVHIGKGETASVKVFYTAIQDADTMNAIEYGVFYIMKSGGTLKKPIGKADITVQFHTPLDAAVKESPGSYTVKKTNENYIKTISWELTNLLPKSDISISFDFTDDPIELMTGELLKELQVKKSPGTCFSLIMARQNPGKQSGSLPKEMKDVLIPAYRACLEDSGTSANAAGFIISDIKSNPELTPGDALVKKVAGQLEEKAARFMDNEVELAGKVLLAVKAAPLNFELKSSADNFLESLYNKTLEMRENNYFIKMLYDRYEKVDIARLYHELASLVQSDYFQMFNALIEKEKDNKKEIIQLVQVFMDGPENQLFQNELEKRITELTATLWNKKNKPKETYILEKLLHVMHSYYIAYNMACAYSRMENGKESINWLKVALKMNTDLKKLASTDKDLTFVREQFKKDFNNLVL